MAHLLHLKIGHLTFRIHTFQNCTNVIALLVIGRFTSSSPSFTNAKRIRFFFPTNLT